MRLGELPVTDSALLCSLVSMAGAVDALEAALRGGMDPSADPVRPMVELASGQALVMPAEYGGFAGVKLATVTPGNPACGLPRIQGLL